MQKSVHSPTYLQPTIQTWGSIAMQSSETRTAPKLGGTTSKRIRSCNPRTSASNTGLYPRRLPGVSHSRIVRPHHASPVFRAAPSAVVAFVHRAEPVWSDPLDFLFPGNRQKSPISQVIQTEGSQVSLIFTTGGGYLGQRGLTVLSKLPYF